MAAWRVQIPPVPPVSCLRTSARGEPVNSGSPLCFSEGLVVAVKVDVELAEDPAAALMMLTSRSWTKGDYAGSGVGSAEGDVSETAGGAEGRFFGSAVTSPARVRVRATVALDTVTPWVSPVRPSEIAATRTRGIRAPLPQRPA